MAKECPSTRSSHDINNRNIQTYSNMICNFDPFVRPHQPIVFSCRGDKLEVVSSQSEQYLKMREPNHCKSGSMMFNDVR